MILTLMILFFKFIDQQIKLKIQVEYLTLMIKKQNIK